jgi:hypothetical protein
MLQEILSHASITTTLDPCPGEMDRYVDRLNEAARMSDVADDAAKKCGQMTTLTGQIRCEDHRDLGFRRTLTGACLRVRFRQDRHDITELQFRLRFRAVHTRSRKYAHTL